MNNTLNMAAVIRRMTDTGLLNATQAEIAVKVFIKVVTDAAINRETVKLRHFGTFTAKDYGPRKSFNLATKQVEQHPERTRLVFSPAKYLKDI